LIQIKRIYKENFPQGKKIIYQYSSNNYYDVSFKERENGWAVDFTLKHLDMPFHKYLEGYIVEFNGEEAGIVSFNHEKWHHVLRINDIHIDQAYQQQGIGSKLMALVKKRAAEIGVRAIVLETQTSNFPAIQFYRKHGFHLIGCDLISYSNKDIEKREVRIEMGLVLES